MAMKKLAWVTTSILLVAAASGSRLQDVPAAMVGTGQGDFVSGQSPLEMSLRLFPGISS